MSMRTALTGLSASQTELSTIANNIANSAILLLAFFVVMYSISSLNEGKYRVMSASLVAAFKGEPMKNTPIALVTEDGLPSNDPINLQNPLASGGTPPTQAPVQAKQRTLAEISHDVANAMADLVIKDQVVIRKHEDWIEVEIKNDVLFPSGSANLTRQANGIVRELGAYSPVSITRFTSRVIPITCRSAKKFSRVIGNSRPLAPRPSFACWRAVAWRPTK